MELEFYDYSTEPGRAETLSTPHDPRAKILARKLFSQYVPQEMQAPMPTAALRHALGRARREYLAFQALSNVQSIAQLVGQHTLSTVFDWGLNM